MSDSNVCAQRQTQKSEYAFHQAALRQFIYKEETTQEPVCSLGSVNTTTTELQTIHHRTLWLQVWEYIYE